MKKMFPTARVLRMGHGHDLEKRTAMRKYVSIFASEEAEISLSVRKVMM